MRECNVRNVLFVNIVCVIVLVNIIMNFGEFLYHYEPYVRTKIRRIETQEKKLAKTKVAILFNRTCLNENLLPTYTNITTHDPAARNERFTIEYRKQLIYRQVACKSEQIVQLQEDIAEKYEDLATTLNCDEQLGLVKDISRPLALN